ncbi:MAG: carboxypeptidase-like regulatory domain-containing protein, partial [Draconibacterium sp.]|nr:carboxypeptidase-like regulatory domain-containing protein [Draconibacterium sp.]
KAYEWKNSPEFASDNQLEVGAYYRVDKLKEQNVVKGIDAIGNMVLTSYVNAGKIDIGPVYDIYSTNLIEGNRFNLPLRTSEKMFKYFSVGGYLGMGTKTKELKYGVNFTWQPLTTDKFIFRFYYYNDYYLVSQDKYLRYIKKNPNTRGNGNFIAAFTSREQNPYLKEENSFELRMELNAEKNFTLEASPYYLSSTRTENVHFIRDGTEYETYSNYGVLFNCRLAFGQHYDKLYFDRVYYLNQTPVINLSWDIGQTRLPNGSITDFGIYSQFHGSIEGRLKMGQLFMNYMFNAGYLLGDAPYDLLDQPVGSMSLGYAKYRYNLLHHASFAHNLYTNTHLHFNGGGIILNRIPLIKRLKLREIVSFKLHYGTLNSSYKGVFDLPGYYSNDITTPYSEIGFGVTNIFKVLRIEYVHLLGNTYSGSSFTDKSGIRLRAEMSF